MIPAAGVEPARPQRALDFESSASANSATPACWKVSISTKAVTGFEPVMKVLQTSALPLGYTAIILLLQSTIKWRLYWGSWIRTNAWRSQSPLPYRLAIPQKWKGEWWESNPRMPEPQSGALTTSPHPPW